MRVLVLGGLGNFGARICKRLALEPGMEVLAGSRSLPADTPFADSPVRLVRLDMDAADFPRQLLDLGVDLLIHCAGPFQQQGYRVAEACCAAGVHYIDIADGRDFVADFPAAMATRAETDGVCLISGASTVPALSSAVVDRLAEQFASIDGISVAIAPGQQAPRGVATMRAVLSYAGKPFPRLRNGAWRTVYGWHDLRAIRFAGLGTRWGAACDIPDLALFAQRYPTVKTIEFRAALELRVQHLVLWGLAGLRRLGVGLPLECYAPRLEVFTRRYLDRFGGDRGGMMVRVSGRRPDGSPGYVTWHLTAPDGNGPEIPCMAAVLLALRMAASGPPASGAFACIGLLELDAFEPEFRRWGITTELEEGDSR
ncbi:Saccharopine dehydrogenase NADP binding domain-containing protein [Pseudomonas linyingensis]|uniref:Saccharopine dehydrogenase NADP binding domain-containing protein n=1 Tax=Pseudomonas linyingensis TaxID=915471 RepID=A0A1H6X700_9PSED|nr:saccharopine dehydrogenase NADP-binding domain-containing protein [Pseudomonas linyingensis]SEJ23826.1 Saccharopine dehydrogenase NADP binding domain-containing protein [Pseudomonas linyingensis]